MRPSLAAARKANARAIFHARRNLRLHCVLPQNPSLAFTLGAGIGNHIARPLARGARPRDAEEALLVAHLPAARARAASRGTFAGRGA